VVVGAVALLAGASPPIALRLGAAMLALQAGIGAANDLIDAPSDAVAKPRKPIASGRIDELAAERVVMAALAIGLALSALSGLGVLGLALVGTAIGLAYDLRLKGTPWSWLGFALGVPLLPLYGWVGTGSPIPGALLLVVALAVPAGAALAIANALADAASDTPAGTASVATALGRDRAWLLGTLLQVVVVGASVGALGAPGWFGSAGGIDAIAAAALAGSGLVIALGLTLGRSRDPSLAGRGWELQALGLGCLAIAWLGAVPLRA
jgi:4-hydroxybenzoate polyprenyltransferase